MRRWLLPVLIVGCERPTEIISGLSDTGSLIGEWHGLEEESAWTFRDDAIGDEAPEPEELVLARYAGEGQMELRRGERWADADPIGSLSFELTDGLTLIGWEVDGASGEGIYPVYEGEPTPGATVSNGSWSCEVDLNEDVETFYGIFPASMRVGCTIGGIGLDDGSSGDTGSSEAVYGVTGTPAGYWSFAPGIGLVRVQSADFDLNLVAPW